MSNDKKQTAVQMAFEKLAQQGLLVIDDYENLNVYHEAKAMEEEQIILAHNDFSENKLGELLTGKQYYNKTYKTK
jgi:hypothetical protein